jgi:hypothetical protein
VGLSAQVEYKFLVQVLPVQGQKEYKQLVPELQVRVLVQGEYKLLALVLLKEHKQLVPELQPPVQGRE